MPKRLRVLDLFAGCGGLSKGLEAANFDIRVANEIWSPAAATYRQNHPGTALVEGDVTLPSIQNELLQLCEGGVDLVVGGPPCQAYSLAGRRDPNDPRGRLFEDYVSIVSRLRPRAFVMENVKGLLTMKHDRENLSTHQLDEIQKIRAEIASLPDKYTRKYNDRSELESGRAKAGQLRKALAEFQEPVIEMITRRLSALGYAVDHRVLNAADFGVPQRRERVIIMGLLGDVPPTFPTPTHSEVVEETLFGVSANQWRTVREAIDDLKDRPEDVRLHHILPRHGEEFLEKIRRTPIGGSVFESYSDAFYRCHPDAPSRTVKENHNGVFVHYDRDRVMTPRELARLQDFDDAFVFHGSKSIVLKQIGNAVPVGLGAAIGGSLAEQLN